MLESILAVVSGGATGILGTIVSAGTEYFQARQRHDHEIALRRVEMEMVQTEAASAERMAAMERESEQMRAEHAALEASYRAATTRMSAGDSRWLVAVDVIRGLTRPVLTLLLVTLAGVIYFTLSPQAGMRAQIVDTVLYLATTTVLWWFGARHVGRRR